MKKLLLLLVLVSACAHPTPVVVPVPEVIRTVATIVETEGHQPVVGATCKIQIDVVPGSVEGTTSDSGYVSWTVPGRIESTNILCSKSDFNDLTVAVVLPKDQNIQLPPVTMLQLHVDPSSISLEALLHVRGALFTARYPMPCGPRPSDPTNIINIGEVFNCGGNETQQRATFKSYTDHGYTHGAMGPWMPDADQNYHGVYPQSHFTFDQFLDQLQTLLDVGIIPSVFVKPDGWSCQDLERLTPFYSSPRAQRLVRFIGPMGWEPDPSTPNSDYVCAFSWAQRVLPNAVTFLHMVADFDAPGNDGDFTPCAFPGGGAAVGWPFPCVSPTIPNEKFIGFAGSWNTLIPRLDAYFVQVGGYVNDRSEVPTPGFLSAFCNHWHDLKRRFNDPGYRGYSNNGAHGRPVWVIYAEGASYRDFWDNFAERYALDLGDLAISCGADGYFDGGRVPVQ